MANVPASVASMFQSQGSPGPINMVEVQTAAGQRFFWADAPIMAPSFLGQFDIGGQPIVQFQPVQLAPPTVKLTGNLVTQTADVTIGNLVGDTVQRAMSVAFTKQMFWGALLYYRLYLALCEHTMIDFLGNVGDAEIDEQHMELPVTGFCNWGAVKAPFIKIDPSCSLPFGSPQCGSSSATPCQNSFGSCTSLERFTGAVTLWTSSVLQPPLVQIAQPSPTNIYNPTQPG